MTKLDGSLLRHRHFRTLWIAGFLEDTIDWMLITAIPIFVYRMSGSAFVTSVAFLVELLPGVLVSPLAGVAADRFDRRRLLLGCALVQATLVSLLLLVTSHDMLWLLYGVIAARATCAQFLLTAKNALLPTLVGPDQGAAASNLVVLNSNLGRLVGSFLGGAVVAGGLVVVAVASAALLLLAAALISRIRPPAVTAHDPAPAVNPPHPRGENTPESWWRASVREWREGVSLLLGDRRLRATFASMALCAVGQGLFAVLFVIFVARTLNGSDAEIGLLRSVQGIGGIAGGLALGALGNRLQPKPLLTWGALSFAVLAAIIWNAPMLALGIGFYIGMFIVVGLPGGAYYSGVLGMIQQCVPPDYRGRALGSFYMTFNGAQALGMAAAGILGDLIGPVPLLNVQAAFYLAAGLLTLMVVGARNTPEEHVIPAPRTPEPTARYDRQ